MEDIMLQRYDISMDGEANRLSIKEFAILGHKSKNVYKLERRISITFHGVTMECTYLIFN
jgi:hypothetical protein